MENPDLVIEICKLENIIYKLKHNIALTKTEEERIEKIISG